jgi:nitrogen-specific signal transduction histidine kinase
MTGVVFNITERKKAEENERKIVNLESIGLLAGGIAHDFNNILGIILGNISLAGTTNDIGKYKKYLKESETAIDRAIGLTQQLLTFSKGGAPNKKLMDLSSLVRESSEFSLMGSNVKPEYQISNDLWDVEVDKGQISQVITNLTINAKQAMPNGGNLTFILENYTVESASNIPLEKGNYVKITVSDQGDGISKENISKIFLPYFTTKQTGSGLGLATAYSIIKKHSGYIEVDSKREGNEKGTTFKIYLPASAEQFKEEEIEQVVSETPKYKILVMDDEKQLTTFMSRMLTARGHIVEVANDGTEALAKYKTAKESGSPFDLVVSDLTVPGGMGGKELCDKLHIYDPNVVIYASSGYSTDPIIQKPKAYGFEGSITKPFGFSSLEKMLQR